MTMLTGLSGGASDPVSSSRDAQQSSPQTHAAHPASDQAVENAALAGAAAIRRVIGERNELRRERDRLSAVNDELRDQIGKITMVRDQSVQLASDLFAQLKQIHHTLHTALQKTQGLSPASGNWDATLVDLARRFSPAGSRLQGRRD
jgi:small-conductance mechanosensitive channel